MNKREDILDAWITIEQLSEGSINKKEESLKPLYTKEEDWTTFFFEIFNRTEKTARCIR